MAKYDVTIEATIRKTIQVEADGDQEAIEAAHQLFTVAPEENGQEKYTEETIACQKHVDVG